MYTPPSFPNTYNGYIQRMKGVGFKTKKFCTEQDQITYFNLTFNVIFIPDTLTCPNTYTNKV